MKKNNPFSLLLILLMSVLALGLFLGGGEDVEYTGKHTSSASTLSSKPTGLKGFYLVLQKWHPTIHRWKRPLYALSAEKVKGGVLVIADPIKPLSPLEKDALDQWIEEGGLAIVLSEEDWTIEKTGYHKEDHKKSFRHSYGVYAMGNDPKTIASPNGRGKLMLVPKVYDNQTLQKDPQQIVNMVQQIVEHGGPIYFDEYHLKLGEKSGFMTMLRGFLMTKWGAASLHLFFVFLLALSISKRSQFKEESPEELSSHHLIISRGLLLQSAGADEFCKKVIIQYQKNRSQESEFRSQ